MYTKSCLNWVGNKYRHLDKINKVVGGRKYRIIIEPFMGSGNILLNITAPATTYIGSDNIPLVPKLYSYIKEIETYYTVKELEDILEMWNNFTDKKDYYTFRGYWNDKYTAGNFDKDFIYETVALLKMCSNSMVRFNRNGRFNQGFRGLVTDKTEFFSERMRYNIIRQLNSLSIALRQKNYIFRVDDFKDVLEIASSEDLLILDPPYIMRTDMYDTQFSKEDDEFLLDFLANTKSDFLYFNYLESGGTINKKMNDLFGSPDHKFLRFEHINDKTKAGQGRKGTKKVKEVIITNIESH